MKFHPLTKEVLQQHVRTLVKTHGVDHTYANVDVESPHCEYHTGPNGTGCIIGEALALAGIPRRQLARFYGSAFYLEINVGRTLFADSETKTLAAKIQQMQDTGDTWGSCLEILEKS